ncbi:protein DpdF [Nonomuraea angiospora]|uniref:protein DpdF n=1 Tax=Nonomuraea angiospora TaxID=46172 RepID=UPI0029ABB95E|nr:protein DpdF [Nonomuraea angiospora]MDX3106009.1 protein DpdF [Nonomuraea angiospora]
MTAEFDIVQRVLLRGSEPTEHLSGPHRRLADAWRSDLPGSAISGDIAALLGQVLRHQAGVTGQRNHRLEIDLDKRGIDLHALKRASLRTDRFGATRHIVRLGNVWAPDWLHGDPRWIDLACASPGPFVWADGTKVPTYARPNSPVPVDPAVQAIAPNIDHYRSRSQASAIRTAALADPASTLHVVLPTGTGKSIVGLAPGLLRSQGTTVVVVPTTALALDQERQLRGRFPMSALPRELAYYSDRANEEREAIRERLRDGTQRILLTSPETVVSGFASLLRTLAASGQLTHLVIDEAHLVRLWGLSFRPEFQIVASLVGELREVAIGAGHLPPRVTLLTATLSAPSLLLNDQLFAGTADSLFVGSTFLRTELRYFRGNTTSSAIRIDRVVEALHLLPRPAIIYTTKKEPAQAIAARLRAAGFARTAVFHGDLGSTERLNILREWSGGDSPTSTDVVVGTSAFGLGVDQSDVRTVVHACVPASVDRFYQEVGRAGRDGHAALSVWLPADSDTAEGRQIEAATMIGNTKAWNRWDAMRASGAQADKAGGGLILDVGIVPEHNEYPSDANQLWNRNTLVLMERASLITIEKPTPPVVEQAPDESEEAWRTRFSTEWATFTRRFLVRLRPHVNNLDRKTFESGLHRVRAEIRDAESVSMARVARLLDGNECWGRVLAEEYSYADMGTMRATQTVASACSGCPADEHVHQPTFRAARPLVAEALMPDLGKRSGAALEALAVGHRSIVVTYADGRLRTSLSNLVQACVTNGVRGIAASATLFALPAISTAYRFADEGMVVVDAIPTSGIPARLSVPSLILIDHGDTPPTSWLSPTSGPLRVVVVPESMRDPAYPDELVKNIRSPHWNIDDFLRRI